MVIAAGALKKRKGFDVLIDALSRIVTPAMYLLVVRGREEKKEAARKAKEATSG